MRTRASLAAIYVAGLLLVLTGVFLLVIAIGGYGQWDRGQRVLAGALGIVVIGLMVGLLALITRQLVLGRPRVAISATGLAIGSNTIPWPEIVAVAEVRIYGIPFLAFAQPAAAPQRVRGLDRLLFMPLAGRRVLFLGERQLGEGVAVALRRARSIRDPQAGTAVDPAADADPWWRSH
jgi:hypothetical protein